MLSKSFHRIFSLGAIAGFLLLAACSTVPQNTTYTDQKLSGISAPSVTTASVLYEQPVDANGKILHSAWRNPDGSNYDEYVWDDFTLLSDGTITEIDWYGLYDPLRFGKGGPAVDFTVSIYPSSPAGTEPAVAGQPLVEYQTGGNAGETAIGAVGNAILYTYAFTLPAPFTASSGVRYWVQVEASQQGSLPDWCLAAGRGGDASHYWRGSGAGGDILYRSMPGDAAFTLLGPVVDTATPTDTPTALPTDTPADTPTGIPTDTATATQTPTDTAKITPTLTVTPTSTPTDTLTASATSIPTDTPTVTLPATSTPTNMSTNTPTSTPTPLSSTPGKVTGGGNIDSNPVRATFGFVVQYNAGDLAPKGNLTYQDHTSDMRLKALSFGLLMINGDHAWFSGTGELKDGQVAAFTVEVNSVGEFFISIPELNGYTAGGTMSGGNIRISMP